MSVRPFISVHHVSIARAKKESLASERPALANRAGGNDGYDGQLYHAIAHGPLDLAGTDRFIDAPYIRYSRILLAG